MICLHTIIVKGMPKSIQANSLSAWKTKVATVAKLVFVAPLTGNSILVRITIYYDKLPSFDTDNISKPIVDALEGIAYNNDKQVAERRARRKSLNGSYRIRGVNPGLAAAIAEGEDFVCIEVRKIDRKEAQNLL